MTVQPYSQRVCHQSIHLNRILSDVVASLLTKVKTEHHDVLKHAAGQLFLDEFLDDTARVACGKQSRKARRQFIEDQTSTAVARLQECEIIPVAPPWFSLTWFVLRWVIIPFIRQLIEAYADKQEAKMKTSPVSL